MIHNFIDNIIVTRRQELVDQMTHDGSTKEHDNEIEMTKDRKSRGLLDILLQTKIDGKPLTDMDIREETSSFMLAVFAQSIFFSFFTKISGSINMWNPSFD